MREGTRETVATDKQIIHTHNLTSRLAALHLTFNDREEAMSSLIAMENVL